MQGEVAALPAARQRIWSVATTVQGTVETSALAMQRIVTQFARRRPFFVVQGIDNEDEPGRYIARLYFWEPVRPYEQGNLVLLAGSLSRLQAQMPTGVQRHFRQPGDHQRVIEVWI